MVFIEKIVNLLEAAAKRLIDYTRRACVVALTGLMVKCFVGFVASALVVAGLVWLLLR